MTGLGKEALALRSKSAQISLRQLGWPRVVLTIAGLIFALLITRYAWSIPFLVEAERALFDGRQIVAAEQVDQDSRVVMVTYTDETLIATGKRSPLDRAILAKTLARIDAMGAKAIGIDILFDQAQPVEDPALISALKAMKTPTFLAHASAEMAEDKILFGQQAFLEEFQDQFAGSPVRAASIIVQPDKDNVLRRWTQFSAKSPTRMPNAIGGVQGVFSRYEGSIAYRLPQYDDRPVFNAIPIDTFADDAVFAIPEAAAIIAEQIKGKFVFVGGTIQDIDLFETPLTRVTGKEMWGMETFAHMLAQSLDGKALRPISANLHWFGALLAVIVGGMTALGNLRLFFFAPLLIAQLAALAVLPFLLARFGWDTYDLSAAGWIVGWLLAFAAVSSAERAIGSEQRKFAQSALGKYLPRDIAKEIMRDPANLNLTGQKREIFVVFTDLEGFTKLSHAIEPEMVAMLLNRYLEMLSDVVLDHGGTIDKFVGDAVVAFWGAPISRADDGERAVKAAIAMHEAGETFRLSAPEGVPPIGKTRAGLHFGEAIVGNFGGEGRIQYTALGDSMNTAARLESANKQTKTSVLVSREAMERSGLDFFRPMGRVVLRGRATPIDIFEPLPHLSKNELQLQSDIILRAIDGDVQAITQLTAQSDIQSSDPGLANLLDRLSKQDEGGYFVLD